MKHGRLLMVLNQLSLKGGKKSRAPGAGKQGSNVFPTINFWLNTLFLFNEKKKDRIKGGALCLVCVSPIIGNFFMFQGLLTISVSALKCS